MARKAETDEKKDTKVNVAKTTTGKKIATGSTQKLVQRRSSSVAGKASRKKETPTKSKTTTTKSTTSKSKLRKDPETKSATKTTSTTNANKTKKATTKSSSLKVAEKIDEQLEEVVENKAAKEKKTTSKKQQDNDKIKEKSDETIKKGETVRKEKKDEVIKKEKDDNVAKKEKNDENVKKEKNKKEENKKEENKKEENKKEKSKKEENKKEENNKLEKRRNLEIQEAVRKELKSNKKISNVEFGKMNTRVFRNILFAVAIMLYLNFVILGFVNIENSVFITDLKVFSIAILVISIIVFEHAYKKDSGSLAIHGIEILLLAFITMGLIYVDLMWQGKLVYITSFISYAYSIYYVAKSIIIYRRMKKEYFVNQMKKIIKKEKRV